MSLALGLDLGTSGVRALAVDEAGRVVAERTRTYPLLTPRPGWTEQRPENWFEGAVAALRELVGDLVSAEVAALGLSGVSPPQAAPSTTSAPTSAADRVARRADIGQSVVIR